MSDITMANAEITVKAIGEWLKNNAESKGFCGEYEDALDALKSSVAWENYDVVRLVDTLLKSADRTQEYEFTVTLRAHNLSTARSLAYEIVDSSRRITGDVYKIALKASEVEELETLEVDDDVWN